MSKTIDALCAEWMKAKQAEYDAKARRLAIEEALAAAVPCESDEGSAVGIAGSYKVTVTRKMTRTVDTDALSAAWALLPENARKVFRWKADIDTRAMRAAQDMSPDDYASAAQFITAKPAKPAIKVEES